MLVEGELCHQSAEHKETLFQDSLHGNRTRDLNTSWAEAKLIMKHWEAECRQFREELRRWQHVCNNMSWSRKHRPEFATEEDMERQRYPHDAQLTARLKKLKDWEDSQALFQRAIDKCKQRIERARRGVEAIQREDPEVVANKGTVSWLET